MSFVVSAEEEVVLKRGKLVEKRPVSVMNWKGMKVPTDTTYSTQGFYKVHRETHPLIRCLQLVFLYPFHRLMAGSWQKAWGRRGSRLDTEWLVTLL